MIHTNTVEEFKALDTDSLIQAEQAKFKQSQYRGNNRFVLLVFGDLKTYNFSYRFVLLRLDTSNLGTVKANIVPSCLNKDQQEAAASNLLAYFKEETTQIES